MRRRHPCRHLPPPRAAVMDVLEPRRHLSRTTYTVTNLVSDGSIAAQTTDPNLVNPWGVSFAPNGPLWVSDNGTGLATAYSSQGIIQPPVVTIPGGGGVSPAAPTGQVFNPTSGFEITSGGFTAPATFIFVGEDGGISGWNSTINPNHAIIAVDQSAQGSVFKGAAFGTRGGNAFLFVTDFHNDAVDVFDSSFHRVVRRGAFVDPQAPAGFAPFNVQNIGGELFVTYARQDAAGHDDVAGSGNGFVAEFDTRGTLIKTFDHVGALNSPWGLAAAPADWGSAAGEILVGQFGSGQVAAFDPRTGHYLGLLRRAADGRPLRIDGLWSLTFGSGSPPANTPAPVFFTAGPNDEANGLLGTLTMNTVGTTAHRQINDVLAM